jgi:hypothetical protein
LAVVALVFVIVAAFVWLRPSDDTETSQTRSIPASEPAPMGSLPVNPSSESRATSTREPVVVHPAGTEPCSPLVIESAPADVADYVAAVNASNARAAVLDARIASQGDVAESPRDLVDKADTLREFAAAVSTIPFSDPAAAAQSASLLTAVDAEVALLTRGAEPPENYPKLYGQLAAADATVGRDTAAMREVLGLPPSSCSFRSP